MGVHAHQAIERVRGAGVPADEARAFAVTEFRRLADAVESGTLRGAHVQWTQDCARIVVVEVDPWCRYCDANIEHSCKRAVRIITHAIVGRTHDMRGDPLMSKEA